MYFVLSSNFIQRFFFPQDLHYNFCFLFGCKISSLIHSYILTYFDRFVCLVFWVHYNSGDLADKETKVISLSALKGFLDPIIKEKVNYVNAELMLRNMGIEMVESKSSQLDKYTNLITVKFTTKKGSQSVSGTIFAKEEMRIVDFFGYKLDFEPSPYVIAVQNIDKPGMIGRIGSTLGAADINIAAMQWSRNKRGEKHALFILK
ncbi:MAG: hypothetical protein ACOX3L_09265 [Lutisporaceae bacterium]